MKHLDPNMRIRVTAKANAFLKVLTENGTFARMIDAYVFAAAYAMKQNLPLSSISSGSRHDITTFSVIDPDVRLALESGVYALYKRNGKPQLQDSQEVAEIIMQYAEIGLFFLQERWQGKIGSQIQNDISKIVES